ncbi:MAG TPA: hypothetical protein VIX89_02015 [Bryobacteraceae bacterium]
MAALALALWLLAPQPPPEPSAEQKQVNVLIAQIRRLAASEPAIYGVDTRIRTAETVAGKYPKLARELLHDAEAELGGVNSQDERDHMRIGIVHAFAPLDLEEAERLAKSLRRRADRDYMAQAYDQIYLCFEQRPAQAREIVSKGFAAGAFRMTGASRWLEDQSKKSPESATALFAEILGAFPVESPSSEDVLYLLEQTRNIATVNRALAIEAIDKALGAAASESLRIPPSDDNQKTPQAIRDKMFREIAGQLGSIDPALLKRYQEARKELDLPVQSEKEEKPKEEKKEDDDVDLGPIPYSEALARARKMGSSMFRTVALIGISRREDLTAQQRASVASEALSAADKMPPSDGRLIALAMISRDFARRGELANAGLAAQLLLDTHNKVCACAAATCRYAEEKFDCMQNVEDFAEYLDEFKISAEALSLDNISLQARMLVLKLHALLKGN